MDARQALDGAFKESIRERGADLCGGSTRWGETTEDCYLRKKEEVDRLYAELKGWDATMDYAPGILSWAEAIPSFVERAQTTCAHTREVAVCVAAWGNQWGTPEARASILALNARLLQ